MNTCCFYNGLHRIAPMHCSRDFPRILFSYSSSSAAVAGCPFLSIGVNLSVSYVYSCLGSWDDFLIVQNVDELEKHNVSWGLVLCTSHKFTGKEKGLALKWQKVGFVTFNVLCPHLWALTFPCFTLSIGVYLPLPYWHGLKLPLVRAIQQALKMRGWVVLHVSRRMMCSHLV